MDGLFNFVANFFENNLSNFGEPMKYYVLYWRNYKDLGRASKAEFWWPVLINFIISLILSVVMSIVRDINALVYVVGLIEGVWGLLNIYPSVTIFIRRLHDTNRSGWWYLLNFCCPIIPIIFCIMDPVNDGNKYANSSINNTYSQPYNNTNYAPQETQNDINEDLGGI